MKRNFLLIAGMAFSVGLNAQVTFEVQGKGAMASTMVIQ